MLRIKYHLIVLLLLVGCGHDNPSNVPADGPAALSWSSTYRLQVNKSGTGAGTVTSSPSGINCGATCSKSFSRGTVVTLTATPAAGSEFAGWSGSGCSGTGSCTVTMNANTTVTAIFNLAGGGGGGGTVTLTVNKIEAACGTGTVTSTPAGISCGATCSASFPVGTSVTLSAPASTGRFAGWSGGGCSGTGDCTLTLTANTTVTATYENTPLTITTESLPNGNRGASYSAFITSSGGCGSPDKFSLVSGSLPSGLTMMESYGVQSTLISGTPTTEQTSTFTVKVQDQSGSSTRTFTITINPPTPLVITMPGPTATAGTVGTAYLQNLFASGGKTPYTWSITAGQLPPGLSLISAQNGNRIQGTPTTRGTFTFTLTVTDSLGARTSQQTSITIN